MDNIRLVLYILLALTGVQIYSAWQKDHAPTNQLEQTEQIVSQSIDDIEPASLPNSVEDQMVQTVTSHSVIPDNNEQPLIENNQVQQNKVNTQTIEVKTDVLDILISTQGGNIVQTNLREYPQKLKSKNTVQLQTLNPENYYVLQTGLKTAQNSPLNTVLPTHNTNYYVQQKSYELKEGQNELLVPLTWEGNGLKVTKLFTFKRNEYLIDHKVSVQNTSEQPWVGQEYRRIQRTDVKDSQPFVHTYTGGVYYNEEDKYEKISYEEMTEKLNKRFDKGWAAMIQHYFMTAIIPPASEMNQYYTGEIKKGTGNRYIMGMMSEQKAVQPHQIVDFDTQFYIGPKIIKRLKKVAPGLEYAVDFGFLSIISKPMFYALDIIHGFIKNWGWAIIILTFGLKLLFFPLANKSYRSMAKMRKIMPEIQSMKERFGDDRQRMAKEQMALFKKHGVNPAAGCLPMLIQMPFFMGLYWALLESVELRQAPFMLWIQDLSIEDPLFILPVVMGISMYITQKLNPPPADPMQAKMMKFMPIAFSIIFFMLPAGLVLYSVTNSILSIIQQYVITKKINKTL